MKIEWPLWWCLEPEDQALLMQFQWDNYGYHLVIPPMPYFAHIDTATESLGKISKLMRQPPKHQKRVA